jgi:hypothetical protein
MLHYEVSRYQVFSEQEVHNLCPSQIDKNDEIKEHVIDVGE